MRNIHTEVESSYETAMLVYKRTNRKYFALLSYQATRDASQVSRGAFTQVWCVGYNMFSLFLSTFVRRWSNFKKKVAKNEIRSPPKQERSHRFT